MNAEHIQQIIDLVGGAGEGAYWLAVLLIAKGYFIGVLVVGTIIFIARYIALSIVHACEEGENARWINEMGRRADTRAQMFDSTLSKKRYELEQWINRKVQEGEKTNV
jgi:hypothetical protein